MRLVQMEGEAAQDEEESFHMWPSYEVQFAEAAETLTVCSRPAF